MLEMLMHESKKEFSICQVLALYVEDLYGLAEKFSCFSL